MRKKLENVFTMGIIICSIIGMSFFTGCTKEDPGASDQLTGIDKENYVPFFYLEKGDTVPKGVYREKPDLVKDEPVILFSTENDEGAKATGMTDGSGGYIRGLYISIRSKNDVGDWLWDDLRKIPVDLNEGAGGKYVYLFYSRKAVWGEPMRTITAISDPWNFDFLIRNGYKYAKKENGNAGDVNAGAGGPSIYILYSSSVMSQDPIRELMIVSSNSGHITEYPGWNVVYHDLNKGVGGKYIYLYYKR